MLRQNYFRYSDVSSELARLALIGTEARIIYEEYKDTSLLNDWIKIIKTEESNTLSELYTHGRLDSWDLFEKTTSIDEKETLSDFLKFCKELVKPQARVFENAYRLYVQKYKNNVALKKTLRLTYLLITLYNEAFDLIEKIKESQLYRFENVS
ncbi:hypothetical protein [Vibrio diazotrophicus]|uniref:hypothetical protein n=1 Tax=Vibrio diazotrophicus TaxID=685 RepID=UPI000C9E14B3|nr:hypothetical protein [Vibrio diazotrophicus]PNH91804.1 hypothetical protein C1O24_20960 [Vibrio diazotrophicus]